MLSAVLKGHTEFSQLPLVTAETILKAGGQRSTMKVRRVSQQGFDAQQRKPPWYQSMVHGKKATVRASFLPEKAVWTLSSCDLSPRSHLLVNLQPPAIRVCLSSPQHQWQGLTANLNATFSHAVLAAGGDTQDSPLQGCHRSRWPDGSKPPLSRSITGGEAG